MSVVTANHRDRLGEINVRKQTARKQMAEARDAIRLAGERHR